MEFDDDWLIRKFANLTSTQLHALEPESNHSYNQSINQFDDSISLAAALDAIKVFQPDDPSINQAAKPENDRPINQPLIDRSVFQSAPYTLNQLNSDRPAIDRLGLIALAGSIRSIKQSIKSTDDSAKLPAPLTLQFLHNVIKQCSIKLTNQSINPCNKQASKQTNDQTDEESIAWSILYISVFFDLLLTMLTIDQSINQSIEQLAQTSKSQLILSSLLRFIPPSINEKVTHIDQTIKDMHDGVQQFHFDRPVNQSIDQSIIEEKEESKSKSSFDDNNSITQSDDDISDWEVDPISDDEGQSNDQSNNQSINPSVDDWSVIESKLAFFVEMWHSPFLLGRLNQSIKQSITQPAFIWQYTNLPTTINQTIKAIENHPHLFKNDQTTSQLINQSTIKSRLQSILIDCLSTSPSSIPVYLPTLINQPIEPPNSSINQTDDQSIDQSIKQSIDQSNNQSVDQVRMLGTLCSIAHRANSASAQSAMFELINQSTNGSTNQSIGDHFKHIVDKIYLSINQSNDQSINQSDLVHLFSLCKILSFVFHYGCNDQINNQSINQSIKQAFNQIATGIDQSIEQSTGQSNNQSINQLALRACNGLLIEALFVDSSISQAALMNSSFRQRLINQSINQSTNQSINRLIDRLPDTATIILPIVLSFHHIHSIKQSNNQSIRQSTKPRARVKLSVVSLADDDKSTDQPIEQSNDQSINQSLDYLNQLIDHAYATMRSIHQSINDAVQLVNQSINQSCSESLLFLSNWIESINQFAEQSLKRSDFIHSLIQSNNQTADPTDQTNNQLFVRLASLFKLINQSILQSKSLESTILANLESIKQLIKQSNKDSNDQSIDLEEDSEERRSINQAKHLLESCLAGIDSIKSSDNQSINQSINQSTHMSDSQSMSQSNIQSKNQLINQSAKKSQLQKGRGGKGD